MPNDLNIAIQVIRLTRDPEIRYIPSGKAVASFSGASSKSYTKDGEKKETVSYFDFIAWGRLGEIITEHCKKGMRIAVQGSLQQSRWDDSDGKKRSKIEIVVENFQFLDSKKDSSETPNSSAGKVQNKGDDAPSMEENPFSDSDLENLF